LFHFRTTHGENCALRSYFVFWNLGEAGIQDFLRNIFLFPKLLNSNGRWLSMCRGMNGLKALLGISDS
jgi:hypothetical protein